MIFLMTTAPPEKSPWGMAGKLPPLGLAYVAAALQNNGFEVEIYDNYLLDRPITEVKAEIKKRQPKIVGITCSSLTYTRCIETAKAAKEANPNCKVVVGGPHPSYMPQTMLQHKEIDFVVVGEGEAAMARLAEAIINGGASKAVKIPGVACMVDGEISRTPPEFIVDLDSVPFPARQLLPLKMYDRVLPYLDVNPVDTVSVQRGCPYKCAYCETRELWGATCRGFSPKRVVDELQHIKETYGSKGFYFVGDNFTINKQHTHELCHQIKERCLGVEWICETRTDLVSKELLWLMKSAGCQTIFFGVESGSPRIQEKLGKNIDLHQVQESFKLCKQVGIKTSTSFMLGVPGETQDEMQQTFRFAKSLNADWTQFNIYVACPGSRLYEEVINNGFYDQMDNYLARVTTQDFDYEILQKLQREYQKKCQKSMPAKLARVIKQEGLGSAVKKGVKLIFH